MYGITTSGIFITLISIRLISLLLRFTSVVSVWIIIYLIYPYLLSYYSLISP